MNWFGLIVVGLVLGMSSVGYYFIQYLNGSLNVKVVDLMQVCLNEPWIMKIQREQFFKARQEVLGNVFLGGFQGEDMDFYKRTFGLTEIKVDSKQGKRTVDTIAYYHIWKSANTNIQSLLLQFLYESDRNLKAYYAQKCRTEKCVHSKMQSFSADASRNLYVKNRNQRYPFTFTRDPLTRFISAMSEVEYRSKSFNRTLPLQNKIGSQERVQEFIRMLLMSGGSRSLFRDYEKNDILHVYPMIGTYLLSESIEGRPISLFKIETFRQDWEKLSKNLSLPLLAQIYRERKEKDWFKHNSSTDPLGTSLAAKSLFSYSSGNTHER
jgi:hypothetical protein